VRALCFGICILALVASTRTAYAQGKVIDTVCTATSTRSQTLTTGGSANATGGSTSKAEADPEPTLCDQRHWQTLLIFTGAVTSGLAITATQALVSGERLSKRFSWAMLIASAPQAVAGIRFVAQDMTDGDVDWRDMALLGSTLISTYVAAYSGWSLLRHGQERPHAQPTPAIRVGAAPLDHGVMLGASGRF